ncbi:L-amino acid N-acyltransferase YncA [Streptomyces sp. TverLS-915]|uniref:GNAT family N-acetyltransferase n=1 Tax=Streptomyces sp. TverLS-915 TaxID=1839763 RepID=UPI00081E09B8|nr:GNAT family N-acetyltransferase [Streptomyces sp. TverLS-915]SCD30207.1 L-amino acid N-acyltransferase YncA [Streptomyces sp. TverLS-915]
MSETSGRASGGYQGRIRTAQPEDLVEIYAMVTELAAYHEALHELRATEKEIGEALFGEDAMACAYLAQTPDGATAGFALWYRNFSTWRGRPGIYLEDLYVRPTSRGGGHGKALLAALARTCVERGYERLEWSVLDSNTSTVAFYESMGALPHTGWTEYRLTGESLRRMGS